MQQGRTEGQSIELPSGVQARQSWHPPAMRAAESLVFEILDRAGSLMGNAARLSAWYEQFTRRVQPWSGWSPLSLELRAEDWSSEGQVSSNHRFSHTAYPRLSISRHGDRNQSGTENTGQKTVNLHVLGTSADKTTQNTAGNFTELPVVSREERSHPLRDRILWRSPPIADTLPLQPRLVVSVSPTPRQEIRGGFPTDQPLLAALPEAERSRTESAVSPSIQWTTTQETSSPSPHQQAAGMPGLPPETQGVIEKLIERTVMPTALPGLELRLVSPEQQASAIHRPSDTAERSQPTANGSTPPMPVPAALPTPQLDVNAIADKVYQKLQRRHQLERERRGLY